MEGTQGITIEVPMPVMPNTSIDTASKPVDAAPAPTEEKSAAADQSQTQENTTDQETPVDKSENDKEKVEKTREELTDLFEDSNEYPDDEKLKLAKDAYLAELFPDPKKEGKDTKLVVDTLPEMIRTLKLILALIWLVITNPDKEFYSGEDLKLSDSPPEGEDATPATKLLNGKDSRQSWKEFRDEVKKIEKPVPFSEFMSLVLSANEKHSIKRFKPSKKGKSEKTPVVNRRITGMAASGRKGQQPRVARSK